MSAKDQQGEEMKKLEDGKKVKESLDTLDDTKKLRENTQNNMVQILEQGLQLKLDIHNLREDFQSLLNGVSEHPAPEVRAKRSDKSQLIGTHIAEVVNNHLNVIGPSEKYRSPGQTSNADVSHDLNRSTKLQVTFAHNVVSDNSQSVKSTPKLDEHLAGICNIYGQTDSRNTVIKSDCKPAIAPKTPRRHSPQLQHYVTSASKVTSRKPHHSNKHSSNNTGETLTPRRHRKSESDKNCETPKYQTLKVSDTPSFENQELLGRVRLRSIYKNHKRRLMARRESGDGAPCEGIPNKYVRLSGVQTPVQSIISPMRRLPIRDRRSGGYSPYGQINIQTAASIWRRPQMVHTKSCYDNADRLRPNFFSIKSSVPANNVESPIDPLSVTRPSPEGFHSTNEKKGAQSCPCQRSSCEELNSSYMQNLQARERHPFQAVTDVPRNPPKLYNPKRMHRYHKRQFPKTPKSQHDVQYPLETIDENGLVHIVMTPEHYNQHIKQIYKANHAMQRQAAATSLLPGASSHVRKNTTATGIKDISQISNISQSHHEQPSNINVLGDFHSTFQYPLHSTMNYPLSSTMRNNSLIPDEGHELSSICLGSPLTPVKCNTKQPLRKTSSNVGVNTNDLGSVIPAVDLKGYIDHIVSKARPKIENRNSNNYEDDESPAYKGVTRAKDVESFYCKDVNNVATPTSVNSIKEMTPYPQTPKHVLNSYYTLAYDSDAKYELNQCEQNDSSDCDSSYISIDTDPPKQQNEQKDIIFAATPPNTACTHGGTVTCRCHLKTVKRIYHFDNMRNDKVSSTFNKRAGEVGFSECTVLMDSHVREIHPMEIDNFKLSNHTYSNEGTFAPIENMTPQNVNNKFNDSGKSMREVRGYNSDFLSPLCNSIENISEQFEPDSLEVQNSTKSPLNPLKTVIEIKHMSKKPPISKPKKKQEIVPHNYAETNCLNLAKLATNKYVSAKASETIVANNPNVTMVADGCLGFLRKKKAASAKKDKKSIKSRKFSRRGSKSKPSFAQDFDEEDKENAPRTGFQSAPSLNNYRNESRVGSYQTYSSSQSDRTSTLSGSLADGYIGEEMKRKLSKRMKEFKRNAMSDSGSLYQSFGHV